MVCFCVVLFSLFSVVSAQNAPVTTAASITNAVAGNVTIPLSVTAFINIGQFTLTMKFDTTKVRYVSAITNPLLSGITVSYTSPSGNTQGKLVFNWTSASNFSLTDGSVLANLSFTYVSATGILNWAYTYGAVCQYKTYISGVLTTMNDSPKYLYYINGGISNRSAPQITAPSIINPSVGALQLPITVNGFNNIGAVTLYLEYDTTVAVYQNTFTKNPAFNSSFLVGNIASSGSKKTIVIQWYGGGVSLTNGATLCTLNFMYLTAGTSSALKWFENGPSCEFSDAAGNVLIDQPTANYLTDGAIGPIVKLKGQLRYLNTATTPLNGISLQLVNNSNIVVATTTTFSYTDNSVPSGPVVLGGYYQFYNIADGNYTIRATSGLQWGGVNATDALIIKLHTVGLTVLSGLPLAAADINLSHFVNSTDALLIQLRVVGIINQFAIGDWVYSDTVVSVSGLTSHNFTALATGDVNQSFNPSLVKTADYMPLQKEGIVIAAKNKEIELCFRVSDFIRPGAISLDLNYNTDLIEVTALSSVLKDLNYQFGKGKIQIAWSDIQAINLHANDVVFKLKVIVKAAVSSSTNVFSYSKAAEFADENAEILDFNGLKVSGIQTEAEDQSFSIYPNPCKDQAAIYCQIPESGRITIVLYNSMGQKVGMIADEYKTEGESIFKLNTLELHPGLYKCEIIFKGANLNYQKYLKVIKN